MLKEGLTLLEDVFAFPTSFAQRRLWFLDQLRPGDPTYNIPAAVRLTGRLDIPALQRALDELARRHESLRTTFAVIDGAPAQIVTPGAKLTLSVVDLRKFSEAERELRFQRLADEETQWSFDLAHGPLIRMKLLRMDEQAHVLLLTMHHIISDGWSISVLISEMSALYESFTSGRPASLPELSIQYADYAVWQQKWLQGEILDEQLGYWKRQLAGAPNVLELPADRQRPPAQTFRGASVSSELSKSLSDSLKALSGKNGATLYMTLLSAFNLLLHRYAGQDDILVGSPIAGRNRAEVKGLIGFFLNTLVLRTKLDGNPSFRELLGRVRESTVGAYSHQDVPFERLLEDIQPERDLSRTSLFQVFFNMLNLPTAEVQLPGLSVELLPPRDVGAKFDLTLYVRELNHRIFFDLVFNADLFTGERMAEMLRQYTHLLSQAVENPEQRINEFSLVTPAAEKHLPNPAEPLNDDWRGAVHTIFSKLAQERPERVAVIDRHERWTYGELDALSNQLANCLRERGIRKEGIVVIYGHRSSSLVWALMGVMKAGGASIILDPSYPTSRLVDYIELARPQGFIYLEAAGAFPSELEKYVTSMGGCFCLKLPRRRLALAQNVLASYSQANPDLIIRPDDLAYISFTSGSTGKPKGVEGRHGSLSHFIPWLQQTFGLNETDRYTMLSGLAHDPLQRDIFTPLQTGACICIPEQEEIQEPGRIAEWMAREEVTVAHLTPAMAQLLTETGAGFVGREVHTLRYAFLVGDVLTKLDVARLRRLAPSINCINYYGSAETQRAVSYFRVPDEPATDADSEMRSKMILPLGKGIEDVQLLVLNSAGRLAGIGEMGEIYVRSPHIARGYMGDKTLTEERFIINPFTKIAGDRLYRTGDLGRYLPDGNVEPLGRADHQVKIRGFRIELGEVEATLAQHPQVEQCVVLTREARVGDQHLAAYVVPRETSETNYSTETTDQITFSLFYFGADTYQPENKYHLYLEAAKFADQHGFEAIWTPERHFHEVGSLYPNPAILSAALATVTERVQLRSGSVVLPLHHPIRVAEEWSVVDNLSRGRVGLSIASGWHLRDFVLAPQHYAERKEVMASGIQTLKALWRGETLSFTDGVGKPSDIRIYPKPVQAELPLWVTTSGNPETFIQAGRLGANVLTHLLGQTIEGVAANIALYRESLARHGYDPDKGKVTLMVHTFLSADIDNTLEQARGPFIHYMRSHLGLIEAFAKSMEIPVENFTDESIDTIVSFAFERYSRTAALIGSPQTCLPVVARLREVGVGEIACLIDWMDAERALGGLEHLRTLRQLSRKAAPSARSLRSHLKSRLPDYMLPASITFLDNLPLTPNGKLNRNALPAPDPGAYVARGYEAPVGEIETTLARIWAEALNLDRVGRHDNFFELGGHSLLAASLIERVRLEGFDLDVRALFTAPTVAEMAIGVEKIKEIVL
jgi:natural product biosynthesis luciferase-like monooxygenase protein/amino acid adenylation domain-containing protein